MKSITKDLDVNIIVEKGNIDKLSDITNNVVLQVDLVSELAPDELDNLSRKYNINNVLVGQFVQLSSYFEEYYRNESKRFNIPNIGGNLDYLSIEKNCMISNDIYDISTYKDIYNELLKIVMDSSIENSPYDRFFNVYMNIVNNIDYNDNGFGIIENQTLYGGLINKKCVCEGFSKILQQALSLVDIDSIIIGGEDPDVGIGHIWNQVKIDGKWYNADAACDSNRRRNGLDPIAYLIDDSKLFYKTDSPIAKKCDVTYDNSYLDKKIKR